MVGRFEQGMVRSQMRALRIGGKQLRRGKWILLCLATLLEGSEYQGERPGVVGGKQGHI